MKHEANEGDHGGVDELYELELVPGACTRATEEIIRLLHTPGLSEIASGADSQRSGLNCSARVINSFSESDEG